MIALALTAILLVQDPDSAVVTLDFKDAPVANILSAIQKQTGVPVVMDESARERMDPSTKVSIVVREIRLRSALALIFQPRDLGVQRTEKGFKITVQY